MVSAMLCLFMLACAILNHVYAFEDLPIASVRMNLTQGATLAQQALVGAGAGAGAERTALRRMLAEEQGTGLAPLFEGLGTHYSFIWVGSPAQRVSVIMDTGSHHTAFPCVGCKCGRHMDPHFDPSKSSSSSVKQCGDRKCYFKQSYTEGSSWSAFRVQDKIWVGGPGIDDISARSLDFSFGCQESETGLFRTQKVDGIMGLSAAVDTLPFQMHAKGLANTKMFALCYRIGGGVVTLGGVDPSLHEALTVIKMMKGQPVPVQQQVQLRGANALFGDNSNSNSGKSNSGISNSNSGNGNSTSDGGLHWAKMVKAKGWFTVQLLDVLMRPSEGYYGSYLSESQSGVLTSIKADPARFNSGKGAIVDSGTTDTYLPSVAKKQFGDAFKKLTGREYGNRQLTLSPTEFRKLPVIVFRLLGVAGTGTVDVEVFPHSYMEKHKTGKYTPRIYLTEGSGTVIGANAINEHNVIFDPDGLRVGFAKSRCLYPNEMSSHDFKTSTDGKQYTLPKALSEKEKQEKQDKKDLKVVQEQLKVTEARDKIEKDKKDREDKAKKVKKADLERAEEERKGRARIKPQKAKRQTAAEREATRVFYLKQITPTVLTAQQEEELGDAVKGAVDAFFREKYQPCRPQLAIPCSARCEGLGAEAVAGLGGFGGGGHGGGAAEGPGGAMKYLLVSSEGVVGVSTAHLVQGQQFWRVPHCEGDYPSGKKGALRTNPASKDDDFAKSTRVVPGEDSSLEVQLCSIHCAQYTPYPPTPVVGGAFAGADGGARGGVAFKPVRLNTRLGLEETASACDAADHSSKHLVVKTDAKGDKERDFKLKMLHVDSAKGRKCYAVAGGESKAVGGGQPLPWGQGLVQGEECSRVEVGWTSCTPFAPNCTAGAATKPLVDGTWAGATETETEAPETETVAVTMHFRIKNQAALEVFQLKDLTKGFSSTLKVPMSSISVVQLPPSSPSLFHLGGALYLQAHVTLDLLSLPTVLLGLAKNIAGHR
ncbi:aspartic peptidase domain-containing protein [Ochromonadaceae sp. CCMP2298]|nr:aspartic peptidase domain-containing protein [Ochromonadaceae sp. CCMP2298]